MAVPPSSMMRGPTDISADELAALLDARIITGALDALEAGQTHYVDVPGVAPLREAVASFLNETTGTSFQTSNVVTAGVQEARFLTIQMIGATFGRIAVPAVVHPGVRQALGVRAIGVDDIPSTCRANYCRQSTILRPYWRPAHDWFTWNRRHV